MWKKLHKQSGDKIEFIGINVGINEKIEDVRQYVKSNGMNFPNIFDKDKKIINVFNVMGTPTHIVIDREGTIKYRGAEAPDEIEKHMKELLR